MKKIILLIVTLIGVMFWQSCQYEWFEPLEPALPEEVSFTVDIVPLFNEGCNSSGCHSTGGIAPDLTAANAYSSLFALNLINLTVPEESKLYTKCATDGSMNKYTQPGDPEMILQWIKQGAPNN